MTKRAWKRRRWLRRKYFAFCRDFAGWCGSEPRTRREMRRHFIADGWYGRR